MLVTKPVDDYELEMLLMTLGPKSPAQEPKPTKKTTHHDLKCGCKLITYHSSTSDTLKRHIWLCKKRKKN